MELQNFVGGKGVAKFSQCCKGDAKFSQVKKVAEKFPSVMRKFRKRLRNSSVLDSSSDSLPCTLDWFGKGFEALQNLDSSYNLASILLCHGLYQVLPHSWLVLMIKNPSKSSKLAKNGLVTLARVLNVSIELKGNKYYSKVFKRVYKKLWKSTFWVAITRVVDDMNNYRSLELRPLDAMKSSGVFIIWTILNCVPMAPNSINSSWL